MEREYIAHHIKRIIRGIEHLTASEQPEVLARLLEVFNRRLGSTRRMFRVLKVQEDVSPSTRCLQDLATKSMGAYQTLGSGTAHRHRMFWNME